MTERELEVLRMVADGHSNQEIAEKLIVSLGMVKAHISHIYNKLDVRSRAQAIKERINSACLNSKTSVESSELYNFSLMTGVLPTGTLQLDIRVGSIRTSTCLPGRSLRQILRAEKI